MLPIGITLQCVGETRLYCCFHTCKNRIPLAPVSRQCDELGSMLLRCALDDGCLLRCASIIYNKGRYSIY